LLGFRIQIEKKRIFAKVEGDIVDFFRDFLHGSEWMRTYWAFTYRALYDGLEAQLPVVDGRSFRAASCFSITSGPFPSQWTHPAGGGKRKTTQRKRTQSPWPPPHTKAVLLAYSPLSIRRGDDSSSHRSSQPPAKTNLGASRRTPSGSRPIPGHPTHRNSFLPRPPPARKPSCD